MRMSVKVAAVLTFVALAAYAPAGASDGSRGGRPPTALDWSAGIWTGRRHVRGGLGGGRYTRSISAHKPPAARRGRPTWPTSTGRSRRWSAPTRPIAITDLAVHPRTRNAFISVMRGQGPAARPALLRVDGAGGSACQH